MNILVYYLFGCIDNYSGGFSSEEGVFKRLSHLNFDWKIDENKVQKSNKILKVCEKILVESKLPNDIKVENWDENKGITIISKNITNIIDDYLKNKSYVLGRDYFQIDKSIFDQFERNDYKSLSYRQHLNFLYGVIDSNGIENEFYFYNGYNKCLLTQYVLRCFADEDDQITLESYFRTPWVDKLTINKKGDIWKRIIKKYSR